jgi:hypothetical protein
VRAGWRELYEGAGEEETEQEKNNGFKRWFLSLVAALTRCGVKGVNAQLGTPERVAGQRAACLPQAACHKLALAADLNNPQHTMVQSKTIVLTNDPVSHCPSKHLCTQGACSGCAARAKPEVGGTGGGWRRWPSEDAQWDRNHGAAAVRTRVARHAALMR